MRKVLSTLVLMLLFTCTVFAEADFDEGYVTADGYGLPAVSADTPAQARLTARRAAIVDAQRMLAEYVAGVNVTAETTVESMQVSSDVVKTKTSALIKNAAIVDEESSNGAYRVRLSMPMYGATRSLASAVMPSIRGNEAPKPFIKPEALPEAKPEIKPEIPDVKPEAEPEPRTEVTVNVKIMPTSTASVDHAGSYTGLVVDCSGLGLRPVMSPVIYTDGGVPVYGHKNLDSKKVIANGMASYTTSDVGNMARAGANPFIVKAVALDRGANPVISTNDAQRVLAENNMTHFLDNCAVVFVR
jgi:hypothetical protein